MNTKLYKSLATGIATSLLLASLTVAPVSAQSSSDNGQGSGQSQNQGQGMSQGQGQNQNQGSCATLAQSLGQGQSNTSNQSNGNQSNGNQSNGSQNNGNNGNGNGNNSNNGNDNNGNGNNGNNGNGNQNSGNQSNGQNTNQNSNAQATLGAGPGTAATPVTNCWLSIAPGQKQWYKFHVGARSNKGDENNDKNNANGVDDSDAAIAQLVMDTPGCVTFEIWTLARLNAPTPVGSDASSEAKRKDKEIARGPVGAGSPEFAIVDNNGSTSSNNDCNNDNSSSSCNDNNVNRARLIWRGGSTVSENFYLVVRNVRTDFACTYRLTVAGPTVSFPGAVNGSNGNNANNGNGNNGNGNDNNGNGNNGNGNNGDGNNGNGNNGNGNNGNGNGG